MTPNPTPPDAMERAREMLAAEYRAEGHDGYAHQLEFIGNSYWSDHVALRVIAKALTTPPTEDSERERDWCFIWKWIERAIFDPNISEAEALSVLAHYPGAPWKQGRWNVDHKPYAKKFYEKFPHAAGAHLKDTPNVG